MLCNLVSCCVALCCIVLHCIALYCRVLHCNALSFVPCALAQIMNSALDLYYSTIKRGVHISTSNISFFRICLCMRCRACVRVCVCAPSQNTETYIHILTSIYFVWMTFPGGSSPPPPKSLAPHLHSRSR